jgi:4-amino-4-deoxy-L-arabinose transferase-like glycosyltransferase
VHDEANTAIPLSKTISLAPGNLNLPIRGENHGALPAYVVKASSALFGTTPLAYRSMHVVIGLCTIALIYIVTLQWFDPVAAAWSAALLAFNEYYLAVSARATAHAPHLFFVAGAVYAFSRFLRSQRPMYLYAAGGSLGLAFYCKEHSALLLPLFLLTLLVAGYRHWLRRPHVYLAAVAFFLVIAPDIYWNVTTNRETARAAYRADPVGYATYSSHLERVGGIGLSPYPAMFYARPAIKSLYVRTTGRELIDETPEYPSVNPVLGVLLLGAVLMTTVRPAARGDFSVFLLLMFWGIFGFFTVIARGNPPGRLDPVSWIWVEVTLIPAVILTGARLAGVRGAWRAAAWAFGAGVLLYAGRLPAFELLQAGLGGAQGAIDAWRHTIDNILAGTVAYARRAPLRAVTVAVAFGTVVGLLFGFCCGWSARGRRRGGRHERHP